MQVPESGGCEFRNPEDASPRNRGIDSLCSVPLTAETEIAGGWEIVPCVLDSRTAFRYNGIEQRSNRGEDVNTGVTSREEILGISRELIRKQGWTAVNIRSVAAACGVSVGSIYNYFDSKKELVGETVESIWGEIFHCPEEAGVFQDVLSCVTWMYERMACGNDRYPGFFALHSLGFLWEDKTDGKRRMQRTWQHIWKEICGALKQDAKIRPDAFTDQFTLEQFVDVLFSFMLSAMLRKDYDPSAVLEIVRRTLY